MKARKQTHLWLGGLAALLVAIGAWSSRGGPAVVAGLEPEETTAVTNTSGGMPRSSAEGQWAESEPQRVSASTGSAREEILTHTIPHTASMSGRLFLKGRPLSGVKVQLARQKLPREDAMQGITDRGRKATLLFEYFQSMKTDARGEFSFEFLQAGAWGLSSMARGKTLYRFVPLKEGEHRDLGNLQLGEEQGEGFPAHSALVFGRDVQSTYTHPLAEETGPGPALIRVDVGVPSLEVRILEEGAVLGRVVGVTNESGVFTLSWERETAIRIDIVASSGHVVGSNDRFEVFAPGQESNLPIVVASGQLEIKLPPETKLHAGESIQYLLTRDNSDSRSPLVSATIHGDRPDHVSEAYDSTSAGIEFKALRAGFYRVEMVFLAKDPNGRWLPRGGRMYAESQVDTGKTGRCVLR